MCVPWSRPNTTLMHTWWDSCFHSFMIQFLFRVSQWKLRVWSILSDTVTVNTVATAVAVALSSPPSSLRRCYCRYSTPNKLITSMSNTQSRKNGQKTREKIMNGIFVMTSQPFFFCLRFSCWYWWNTLTTYVRIPAFFFHCLFYALFSIRSFSSASPSIARFPSLLIPLLLWRMCNATKSLTTLTPTQTHSITQRTHFAWCRTMFSKMNDRDSERWMDR